MKIVLGPRMVNILSVYVWTVGAPGILGCHRRTVKLMVRPCGRPRHRHPEGQTCVFKDSYYTDPAFRKKCAKRDTHIKVTFSIGFRDSFNAPQWIKEEGETFTFVFFRNVINMSSLAARNG